MWDWIAKASELKQLGRGFVSVTVAGSSGSAPREIGAKMLVEADGVFHGTIGGGHLEELALQEAASVMSSELGRLTRYPLSAKAGQCCGGTVDLFFEVFGVGPKLYLFGAGHVGQAVARALSGTAFQVHLIDERSEWLNHPALPSAVVKHGEGWDFFIEKALWSKTKTYAAVMTHRHDTDQDIIEKLICQPAKYIGLIGSKAKWNRFEQRLLAKGANQELLARVECPMGIALGGKAPAEIALSLGARILQMHYETSNTSSSER